MTKSNTKKPKAIASGYIPVAYVLGSERFRGNNVRSSEQFDLFVRSIGLVSSEDWPGWSIVMSCNE